MIRYFKSSDFPIHALAAWWVMWLAVSQSELSDFIPPSPEALAQFSALILAFLAGHAVVRNQKPPAKETHRRTARTLGKGNLLITYVIWGGAGTSTMLLVLSLWLSGALTQDFIEYFARLRLNEASMDSLTGYRVLDIFTKIFAFPMSYTVILVVLAAEANRLKLTLLLAIANLLCFSYLWQVNYPLIHLFWILVFHTLIQAHRKGRFDARAMAVMLILFATLLASAVNRFGGEVLGGLQRYIVGYHLIGFSFYDYQLQDPKSILHTHSFGRSSLGFLDQMLEAASKIAGVGYKAASFENASFNDEAVDIGQREVREFNAFGTFLFSMYRDFHLIGIFLGGFIYGAVATRALYQSHRDWFWGSLFLMLGSAWMMGMMVNPLEQAYFWFVIVALGLLALVNRGLRW